MNTNWRIIEKTISALSIGLGITSVILVIYTWKPILSNYFDTGLLTWENFSLYKLFKKTHFFILLGILSLVSGFLLLKNKKMGWAINIACWISYALGIVIIYWKGSINGKLQIENISQMLIIACFVTVFLVFASVLLSKPLRLKYEPNRRSWLTIVLIILIFTLDKIFF